MPEIRFNTWLRWIQIPFTAQLTSPHLPRFSFLDRRAGITFTKISFTRKAFFRKLFSPPKRQSILISVRHEKCMSNPVLDRSDRKKPKLFSIRPRSSPATIYSLIITSPLIIPRFDCFSLNNFKPLFNSLFKVLFIFRSHYLTSLSVSLALFSFRRDLPPPLGYTPK